MQTLSSVLFLTVIFVTCTCVRSKKPVDEQHCEVCIKTISTFADSLTAEDKSNVGNVEKAFKKYCSQVKVDSKEHRLCFYIGALETSATYAVGDLSKPLVWGIPAEKICRERLAKTNPQICDIKFEKQIDINGVDLNKLKVKDLKKILTDWGEAADFVEKSEFVKRINDVKNKYVKSTEKDPIKKDL